MSADGLGDQDRNPVFKSRSIGPWTPCVNRLQGPCYSNEAFAALCVTEDAMEGVDAFLNERKPQWKRREAPFSLHDAAALQMHEGRYRVLIICFRMWETVPRWRELRG
jgi:hypothetical protein